ncbi:MAG: tetratricopeptide repeat protein [Chloroflexi bacterium]|nr:tetratricopeptide repeat protein [Chloroflexota bacterium]
MSDSSPPRLTLHALGGLRLTLDGQPVADLVSRKAEALLIYLACHAQPQPRDVLADLLWDDATQTQAAGNLRVLLNSLRRRLSPFLCIERYSLSFNFDSSFTFDMRDFENCVRSRQLERAVELYRGDFLAGFNLHDSRRFEEWALLERERSQRLAIDTLDELIDADLRARRYRSGIEHAAHLLRLDPLREDAHRRLMLIYARTHQRHAAWLQFQTCRTILRAELDVEPAPETIHLAQRLKAADAARSAPLPIELTPFIGREVELAQIAARLSDPRCRLLTLIGPGGSGKTRLALETARALANDFINGAAFVSLAVVHTADDFIAAVAEALGITFVARTEPRTQLINWLRDRELLLVLDNFEHLLTAADQLVAFLKAAPDLKVLVTSRQRLNLQAEWLIEVNGLIETEATTLFEQSAVRTHPGPIGDRADIARICRLVQGLPLAIELAAAWAREQSCAAIADQIARSLDFLATEQRDVPDRHRSLRVVFDQSWALLTSKQREVLAQLSVFRGGFDGAAAQQVAAADARTLAALIDHSLVRRIDRERYDLHPLVQQYAMEKLAEATAVHARHAAFYADFLQQREGALKGANQVIALKTIDLEIGNVRAMWEWAVNATAITVLHQTMETLVTFYWLRSWFHEGAAVFERAVAAVEKIAGKDAEIDRVWGELLARQARLCEFTAASSNTPTQLYQRSLSILQALNAEQSTALPLFGLGYMAHMRGEFDVARRYYQTSLNLCREAGDQWSAANVLSNLCLTLRRQGEFDDAKQYGLESLTIRRAIDDRRGVASSQNNLGLVYTALGEYASAEAALRESIDICRDIDHAVGMANALTALCNAAYGRNARSQAIQYQREALDLYRQIGDVWGVAVACNNLGQLAMEADQLSEAQILFEESVALYRQTGVKAGLANALSNLGQISYLRGDWPGAARHWREALAITVEIGDVPIGLEILTRAAKLWAQQDHASAPLKVIAFVLKQPALLAESRAAAQELAAHLQARFSTTLAAAAEGAATTDFTTIAAEVLEALRSFD